MKNKNKKKSSNRNDYQNSEEDFIDISRGKGSRKQNRRNRRHNEKQFLKQYGKEIESFEDYQY